MTRSFLLTFVLGGLALAAAAGRSGSQPRADDSFTPLFNGRDLTGWTTFVNGRAANAANDDLLRAHDGTIHTYPEGTDGERKPFGYDATRKTNAFYHLTFE